MLEFKVFHLYKDLERNKEGGLPSNTAEVIKSFITFLKITVSYFKGVFNNGRNYRSKLWNKRDCGKGEKEPRLNMKERDVSQREIYKHPPSPWKKIHVYLRLSATVNL